MVVLQAVWNLEQFLGLSKRPIYGCQDPSKKQSSILMFVRVKLQYFHCEMCKICQVG